MDGKAAGPGIFDEVMHQYMKERDIPAGTLAVSRDGKLLLARGYGFADAEGRRRIEPEDPMRLASVTKPYHRRGDSPARPRREVIPGYQGVPLARSQTSTGA